MYQKILVALEGKPTDEAAILHAVELAHRLSARLTLLWVVSVTAEGPGGFGMHLQTEPGSRGWRKKNQARTALANLEARLRLSGVQVDTALVVGIRSEADEIVAYAEAGDYGLIVMAADGRSWWRRAYFGCIADGVHRKASVPTLFVSDGTRRARVVQPDTAPVNPALASIGDCI